MATFEIDTRNPQTMSVGTTEALATDANREVTYSVSFDEPVQDFTAANVTVVGGAKPTSVTLRLDANGEIVGATFGVLAHDDRTGPLSVEISGVKDLAGNIAAPVMSEPTRVDTQNPDTLVATQEALATDANREVTYSVSFDEPVQNFTAANVTVEGGVAPTSVTLVKDEEGEIIGATFNVVAHDDSTSPLSVSIGGVKDLVGNDALVGTSEPTAVDTRNPDAPVLDVTDLHVTAAEAASGAMLTVTAEQGSDVTLVLRGANFDQAKGQMDSATIARGNALTTVSSEQAKIVEATSAKAAASATVSAEQAKISAATSAKATASATVSAEQAKIAAATSAKATASATVSAEQAKIDAATSAKATASATVTSEQAKINTATSAKAAAQTIIDSTTATAAQKNDRKVNAHNRASKD